VVKYAWEWFTQRRDQKFYREWIGRTVVVPVWREEPSPFEAEVPSAPREQSEHHSIWAWNKNKHPPTAIAVWSWTLGSSRVRLSRRDVVCCEAGRRN
jgi:hypothetical protein